MMILEQYVWDDYCSIQQMVALNICTACGGYGDHGYEEETGSVMVCYHCYGTGKEDFKE